MAEKNAETHVIIRKKNYIRSFLHVISWIRDYGGSHHSLIKYNRLLHTPYIQGLCVSASG